MSGFGQNGSATPTQEFDVVVVGGGGGALIGAYTAAAAGHSTVVLEKAAVAGGTTAYSGAALWMPENVVQARAGVEDTIELGRAYLRAIIGDYDVDRQDAFVETAAEVIALLDANPHVEFEWRPFPDYFDVPGRNAVGRAIYPLELEDDALGELRDLVRPDVNQDRVGAAHEERPYAGGRALIGRMLLALRDTGNAEIRTRTAVQDLIVEDGRVVGVVAEDADGQRVEVRARHGVLLAAGGFERDATQRERHAVPGRASWSLSPPGSATGEVGAAAVALGAATALMDDAWWCTGLELPGDAAAFLVGIRGGLIVDPQGERFTNESQPYDRVVRAMLERGTDTGYLIFDSSEGGPVLPGYSIPEVPPEEHFAAGTWVQADTLAELADAIGVPAETLAGTVERFNGFSAAGVDEDFRRGEDPFDRFFCAPAGTPGIPPNPALTPVAQGPFYAARVVTADLGGKGGLRTDVDARVLREDGSVIEGLYAAGNSAASFAAHAYPSPGIPIGTSAVFAYRGVRHLLGVTA